MVMWMKCDYIEKDFVLYVVNYFGSMLTWSKEDMLSEIERVIKREKPIGDVVRVVRCKDCKRCHDGRCFGGQEIHAEEGYDFYVDDNDFCSYGDRRCDNEAD